MAQFSDASTGKFATIHEASLHNFKIYFNDVGTSEREVVVMVHGGGPGASGWSNFSRNVEAFVSAGYRVLLIDCPGFGRSGEIITDTSRALINAQAIKGILDVLDIKMIHLVGNSMGGASALHFALEYPERLDRLVLMGPGGMGPSILQPNPQEGIRKIIKLYRHPTRENLDDMLEAFVFDSNTITEELREERWRRIQEGVQHLKNFSASMEMSDHAAWDVSHHIHTIQNRAL